MEFFYEVKGDSWVVTTLVGNGFGDRARALVGLCIWENFVLRKKRKCSGSTRGILHSS